MTDEALTELNRKIAVMEASKTQEIEFKRMGYPDWRTCTSGQYWNWCEFDYRVKVEPGRCWINIYPDKQDWCAHESEIACNDYKAVNKILRCSEFIELTPEVKSKLGL